MPATTTDRVYTVLVEHQVGGADGWNLKDEIAKLHEWAEEFRFRFKLEIPSVPLRLARLRSSCLGHFKPGHNDFGIQNEIAIDVNHLVSCLNSGSLWDVLGTLAHEQLHFWQSLYGNPPKLGEGKTSEGNYHNIQFQEKAASLGLLISDRGINEGFTNDSPFLALLKERGVQVPSIIPQRIKPVKKGSKLKKWSCVCSPPVNVRVAIANFQAECLICKNRFCLVSTG